MIKIKDYLTSKFKKLSNRFLLSSIIEVYLGKLGVSITVFSNHKAIDDLFLTHDNVNQIDNIDAFKHLLDKYPGYYLIILVDLPTLKLQQESLIAIDTGIKKNPVDRYIKHNFDDNYLISYNVLDIVYTNSEIWRTQIASIKLTSIIKMFVDIVIMHPNVSLEGCYLLPLELPKIIYLILDSQYIRVSDTIEYQNTYQSRDSTKYDINSVPVNNYVSEAYKYDYKNNIVLTVSVTKASGIIFCLFDQQNIIYYTSIPYCENKSNEYTYGALKHETNEIISSFNLYILESNKSVTIHYMVNLQIRKLIENEMDQSHQRDIIFTNIHSIYADTLLSRLFILCPRRAAYNKYLYNLNRLKKLNSIFLKPILILLMIFTCGACVVQYKVTIQQNKLSEQRNKISYICNQQHETEHRLMNQNVKQSTIEKYYLEHYLRSKKHTVNLQELNAILNNPNVKVESIKYNINDQFGNSEIRIELYYIVKQPIDTEEFYNQVNEFQSKIVENLKGYNVKFNNSILQQNIFISPDVAKVLISLSIITVDRNND